MFGEHYQLAMLVQIIALLCCIEVLPPTVALREDMAVAGVRQNIVILCGTNQGVFEDGRFLEESPFWIVNGSVYGLLHIPRDFMVCCDLNSLTIPVPQTEMDGYTFQCVNINHQNNTLSIPGEVTVLRVQTIELDNGTCMYVAASNVHN